MEQHTNFNIDEYIKQFDVYGNDGELNNDSMCTILYTTLLKRFNVDFTEQEYELFFMYQEKILSLIENLRELDVNLIGDILTYVHQKNMYLVDVIIMMWCFPTTIIRDITAHRDMYRTNIKKYNYKLIKLIMMTNLI